MVRRKVVVAVACLAVVGAGLSLYVVTRPDPPGRGDIDTSAFVAYPGSTLIKDTFQKADRGRYLDTGSYSNPTQLIRRYRLSSPVPRAEFYAWRDGIYRQAGWTLKSEVDANRRLYIRTVGSRHHDLEFTLITGGLDKPLVPEYEITYSVV